MNRKGVTLTELVVYIALLAIVSLLIGKQFKTMVSNYATNKRITRQQSDSRDIGALMAREIRNTGFKSYVVNTGTYQKKTDSATIVNIATDGSSFVHENGTPGDALTFYKISLDKNGDRETGVDSIRYSLSGTNLMRSEGGSSVIVAENVYALQFQYGISATDQVLVDQSPMDPNKWSVDNSTGTAPQKTTSGSDLLLTFSGAAAGQVKCSDPFKISAKQKLSVKVRIVPQQGFPAGLDWLKCAIVTATGTELGSEKFLPYDADILLTVPMQSAYPTCFVYLQYLTKGSGVLRIGGVDILQTDLGSYTWTDNPQTAQKRYIRAIKINVLSRSKDKAGRNPASTVTIADATITRPADYTWRIFTEMVEIPNNGIF